MAKNPPSFQFYPEDFVTGTMHLDHQAIASYLLLLCYNWGHRSLPPEHKQLARITRLQDAEFAEVWPEIEDKFYVGDDGRLHNYRLQVLMDKALELSKKRAECGRIGGQANAKQLPKQKGKQKGSKGRLKTEDRSKKTEEEEMDANFENFWNHVKRKVAKAGSKKHYIRVVQSINGRVEDPHAYLAERMKAYVASDRGKSEYAWEPCSWLRDGHYDDDPETWKQKTGSNTRSELPEPCLVGSELDKRITRRLSK